MRTIMLLVLAGTLAGLLLAASAYDAAPTGYYLPKGYKVEATVYVPDIPFWPGENVGDIVGLSTRDYSVLVVGYASKGGPIEGFRVESGVKVIWKQAGTIREEAKVSLPANNKYVVIIVYGNDGYIKISVNGQLAYSFVGTTNKYAIVAQGAKVRPPEPLPVQSQTQPIGEGYTPPSVNELQLQWLTIGAGAAIILILLLLRR